MKLNSSKTKSNLIFWGVLFFLIGFLFFTETGKNTKDWISSFTLSKPQQALLKNKISITQDWFLENTKGDKKRLLESNKPLFINIWATWCPPCRSELPSLLDLANEYKNKVDFLFISPNEDLNTLIAFANKKGYSFPFYTQSSAIPKELATRSFPTTFIVDKDKKIVLKSVGAHDWNTKPVHQILESLIK